MMRNQTKAVIFFALSWSLMLEPVNALQLQEKTRVAIVPSNRKVIRFEGLLGAAVEPGQLLFLEGNWFRTGYGTDLAVQRKYGPCALRSTGDGRVAFGALVWNSSGNAYETISESWLISKLGQWTLAAKETDTASLFEVLLIESELAPKRLMHYRFRFDMLKNLADSGRINADFQVANGLSTLTIKVDTKLESVLNSSKLEDVFESKVAKCFCVTPDWRPEINKK